MTHLPNLTLNDPLAEATVRLVITVAPQAVPRLEKRLLLSLTIADQPPIMTTGTLGNISVLIQKMWTQCGIRQQAPPTGEPELLAEATVTPEEETAPVTPPPVIPRPQPKNLSLF